MRRSIVRADIEPVDAAERQRILDRYLEHLRRFDEIAGRRSEGDDAATGASPARGKPEGDPTRREIEVLQMIADGYNNREISQQLSLSEDTVKAHIRRLFLKLDVQSRAQAVAVGFRRSLIG